MAASRATRRSGSARVEYGSFEAPRTRSHAALAALTLGWVFALFASVPELLRMAILFTIALGLLAGGAPYLAGLLRLQWSRSETG